MKPQIGEFVQWNFNGINITSTICTIYSDPKKVGVILDEHHYIIKDDITKILTRDEYPEYYL